MNAFRTPTTYPYYDTLNVGRLQSARLYVERVRQIHEIKKGYLYEIDYYFNDTCELLDQMYIDVYKEFFSILNYWYNKQVLKVPEANDLLLSRVSSIYLVNYIQAGSDEPASYGTRAGLYSVTHTSLGTSFFIEIFRGRCVDIKVNASPYHFGTSSYTFNIPKSFLGGAVLGQNLNLTFTAYFISNALDNIKNEMSHFKHLIYRLASRRSYRYGTNSK